MKRSRFLGLGVLLVLGALGVPSASVQAQNANGDLPPMYWYSRHDPVGIGQGVEISTQGMGARNNPFNLDAAMAAGQIVRGAPQTVFESHDFSKTENILSDLKLNLFASVTGTAWSGSLGFNYSNLTSNNIDERKWEVSAVRIQTYSLKKDPRISADAQKTLDVTQGGSTTNFRNLYGNYFISGITYRRRVRVRYSCQLSSNVSEQDIRAAVTASSACFSLKADVKSLSRMLSKFGKLSIEIEIDGLDGAQVISIAAGIPGQTDESRANEIANSLKDLQVAVSDLLSHFDDIPSGSGVEAVPGIPDQVKLRSYSTILPIQIDVFKSPNQDSLNVALGDYIRLDQLRNRISALAGRSYNQILRNYLNKKAQEIETKRLTLVNYMQKLVLNPTTVIVRPNTQVAFEDPEIIRWRYVPSSSRTRDNPTYFDMTFEIIGEVPVTIVPVQKEFWKIGVVLPTDPNVPLPKSEISWVEIGDFLPLTYRDSATGILHRTVFLTWKSDSDLDSNANSVFAKVGGPTHTYILKTLEGTQYFLNTDLTGGRQITITLPYQVYRTGH